MKAYIKHIEKYLPSKIEENSNKRLVKKTGIIKRHICSDEQIASDLAFNAANKLLERIDKEKVEFILYCTQSPDYYLPTTACILQYRLGLNENCGALDYNLGCSGYIYGLSLAKGLIESGQVKNVLLITSETYSKYINDKDHSVRPLFGDAATATFIEGIDADEEGIYGFVLGTKGSGYKNLIVPVGGMVQRYQDTDVEIETDDFGNVRTNRDLHMNGAAISDFALSVVPETLNEILEKTNLSRENIDYYVFHQANKFMLNYLQMTCDLMDFPYWNDVKEYGNTVSNSIPIALQDMMAQSNGKKISKVMSIGFGVGLSWGGCIIDMSKFER